MKKYIYFIFMILIISSQLRAADFFSRLEFKDVTGGPRNLIVANFNQQPGLDAFVSLGLSNAIAQLGLDSNYFFKKLDNATTTVGNGPYAIAAADLDNDGHLDLGIAQNPNDEDITGDSIRILKWRSESNGIITFDDLGDAPTVNNPKHIGFMDFNEDGKQDIYYERANIVFQPGNGNGTFSSGVIYDVGGVMHDFVVGDFNDDNHLDLAATNHLNEVGVLLGDGHGNFTSYDDLRASHIYSVGHNPQGIKTARLDTNTSNDLVVANHDDDTLSILLNNGSGTFTPSTLNVCNSPNNLVLADFNADTKIDIAVICDADGATDQGVLQVYKGNGDGTFVTTPIFSQILGTNPFDIVTDDFNGDGHSDLLISVSGNNKVVTLLGNNEPRLSSASYDWNTQKLSVTYKDDDNEQPAFVRVSIDDATAVDLTAADSTTDYKNGKVYTLTQNLSEGSHRVKFSANDGTYDAKSADETITPVAAVGSITVTAPASSSGGCALLGVGSSGFGVSWTASILVLGASRIWRRKNSPLVKRGQGEFTL